VIPRARPEVAAYVLDWRNDPKWIGGIGESRLATAEPFGIGSRVERVAKFLGKRIEYVNEVEELEPDARLVMHSVKAPFPMRITYGFADARGGTRVSVRVEGDPAPYYRIAGAVLSALVKRSVSRDLARLERLLTTG